MPNTKASKTCKLCNHPLKSLLEHEYLSGAMTQQNIADKTGCSKSHVFNHFAWHISDKAKRKDVRKQQKDLSIVAPDYVPPSMIDNEVDGVKYLNKMIQDLDAQLHVLTHDMSIPAVKKIELQLRIKEKVASFLEKLETKFEKPADKEAESRLEKLIIEVITPDGANVLLERYAGEDDAEDDTAFS